MDVRSRPHPKPPPGPEDHRAKNKKKQSAQTSKFQVNDPVNLITASGSREGPYLIEDVPSAKKYTLCNTNGDSVYVGREFEEHELEKPD